MILLFFPPYSWYTHTLIIHMTILWLTIPWLPHDWLSRGYPRLPLGWLFFGCLLADLNFGNHLADYHLAIYWLILHLLLLGWLSLCYFLADCPFATSWLNILFLALWYSSCRSSKLLLRRGSIGCPRSGLWGSREIVINVYLTGAHLNKIAL